MVVEKKLQDCSYIITNHWKAFLTLGRTVFATALLFFAWLYAYVAQLNASKRAT